MDEAELILESLRRSGIRVSDVGGLGPSTPAPMKKLHLG
jgi:hypothetical protein